MRPRTASRPALAVAALVAAAVLVMVVVWPRFVLPVYVAAVTLVIGAPLGCCALLAMYHLTGGRWGRGARTTMDAGARGMLWAWALLVPIAIGAHALFPWTHPGVGAEAIPHWYLNGPFFIARQVVYALFWIIPAFTLTERAAGARLRPGVAAAWMVGYAITASFAAVDWIAALQPGWISSVLGLYEIAGQTLTAMAVVCIAAAWRLRGAPPGSADLLHDLGNLLLTAIVLHGYMAFSQFFISWNGNLPEEVEWYLPRMSGLWGVVGVLIIAVHFGLPFVALLFRRVKRRPESLLAVAALVLLARMFDTAWMVLPSAGEGIVAFVLLGAIAAGAAAAGWMSLRDQSRLSLGEGTPA